MFQSLTAFQDFPDDVSYKVKMTELAKFTKLPKIVDYTV